MAQAEAELEAVAAEMAAMMSPWVGTMVVAADAREARRQSVSDMEESTIALEPEPGCVRLHVRRV